MLGREANKRECWEKNSSDNNAAHNTHSRFLVHEIHMKCFLIRNATNHGFVIVERHTTNTYISSGKSFSYSQRAIVSHTRLCCVVCTCTQWFWISHKNFIVCFACHLSLLPETVFFQSESKMLRLARKKDGEWMCLKNKKRYSLGTHDGNYFNIFHIFALGFRNFFSFSLRFVVVVVVHQISIKTTT